MEEIGNIYLIGGVLREFKDNNKIINLRDIDIIIDIKNSVCLEKILSKNARENFLDMLMNIQVKRYKREILSKELIENELFQM